MNMEQKDNFYPTDTRVVSAARTLRLAIDARGTDAPADDYSSTTIYIRLLFLIPQTFPRLIYRSTISSFPPIS